MDEIASALQELRGKAGSPSYAEIARQVSGVRRASGMPSAEARVAKSTVYDIFRNGRQRLDSDLVAEVVEVLGVDGAEAARWADECRRAQQAHAAQGSVPVRADLPLGARFVGRTKQLTTLLGAEVGEVIAITGLGGSGKSTLAFEAGRQLVELGRCAGVLVADLRGFDAELPPATPRSTAAGLLRLLGDNSRVPREQAEAVAKLAGQLARVESPLLILDNAVNDEQVAALAGSNPSGITVVTSRRRLDLTPEQVSVELGDFTVDEAAELLSLIVRRPAWAREQAVRQIVTTTGRLPLAVAVTASRMAQRDWSLADHLAATVERPTPLADDLSTSLEASYQLLQPAAQALLRRLADQPCVELDLAQIAPLSGLEAPAAEALLRGLHDLHLVTTSSPGRFSLHDLVREFSRERAIECDRPSERAAAVGRLAHHMVVMVWSIHRAHFGVAPWEYLPPPDIEPVGAEDLGMTEDDRRAWLAANFDGLLALVPSATRLGRPLLPCEISDATSWWILHTRRAHDGEWLHRRALQTAREADDTPQIARSTLAVGQALGLLGQLEEAIDALQESLARFEEAGDRAGERRAVNALAILHNRQGEEELAVIGFERAEALAVELGDVGGQAQAVSNLCVVHHRHGRGEAAASCARAAIRLAEQSGDPDLLIACLFNSVDPLLAVGAASTARDYAQRGVDLGEQRDHPSLHWGLANLGLAHEALGEYADTRTHLHTALDRARAGGWLSGEIDILLELGRAELAYGEAEKAREYYAAARGLSERAGITVSMTRADDGLTAVAQKRDS